MKERIINILTSRALRHSLFWIIVITTILTLFYNTETPVNSFLSAIITILSLGSLVYYNLFYLIPRYLSKKHLIRYIVLLIVAILIVTPIRTLLTYYVYSGMPFAQESILNSHWQIFLAMLLIVILSTFAKIILEWFRSEREMRMMESENMQSELRFLRSQVNPHFLFNTLNSLYALTLKKSDKAPDIVIQLSEMMRYMLYECNDRQVSLQKEIDYIENYLELERLRHSDHVDITFERSGIADNKEIAPLLFIPFLENAFKHGLNKHVEEGYVKARIEINNSHLLFTLKNSVPAELDADIAMESKKAGGIGLKNVKRRLELLYPDSHTLEINNTDKYYAISLSLNLN